jgi:hypothetical protein
MKLFASKKVDEKNGLEFLEFIGKLDYISSIHFKLVPLNSYKNDIKYIVYLVKYFAISNFNNSVSLIIDSMKNKNKYEFKGKEFNHTYKTENDNNETENDNNEIKKFYETIDTQINIINQLKKQDFYMPFQNDTDAHEYFTKYVEQIRKQCTNLINISQWCSLIPNSPLIQSGGKKTVKKRMLNKTNKTNKNTKLNVF